MVRKIILSRYTFNPPDQPGRVKITGGPLYDLAEVQVLASEAHVQLVTQKCMRDVRNLYEGVRDEYDSDFHMVSDLLQHLGAAGTYQDSEWCDNGKGALMACDAYEVSRSDLVPTLGRRQLTRYYLKFAIGKTGLLLLIVSCHV